jgi:hypothetical protein
MLNSEYSDYQSINSNTIQLFILYLSIHKQLQGLYQLNLFLATIFIVALSFQLQATKGIYVDLHSRCHFQFKLFKLHRISTLPIDFNSGMSFVSQV